MEAFVEAHPGMQLRWIDMQSWNTKVSKQYAIRCLPHLVLYQEGKPTAAGTAPVLQQFQQLERIAAQDH